MLASLFHCYLSPPSPISRVLLKGTISSLLISLSVMFTSGVCFYTLGFITEFPILVTNKFPKLCSLQILRPRREFLNTKLSWLFRNRVVQECQVYITKYWNIWQFIWKSVLGKHYCHHSFFSIVGERTKVNKPVFLNCAFGKVVPGFLCYLNFHHFHYIIFLLSIPSPTL